MNHSVLIPLFACIGLTALGADIKKETVATADGSRLCLVATPPGPPAAGRPLVLLFPGHMGSAGNTLGQGRGPASPLSAWLPIVDREGIVLVALDGARGADGQQGWNDGRSGNSGNPTTDDVAFTRAVIARLRSEQHIDPTRIYAMGMSNGGVFTFRLALELDPPLAAITAVCASMPGERTPATAKHAVSVLVIEGTSDPLMPYEGGQVHFHSKLRGAVLGTEASLAFWKAADGLFGTPLIESIPHRGRDATSLLRRTWGAAAGSQVVLLRVEGGGHCEPSIAHHLGWLYTQVCGAQNHDVEAAEEAWSFFKDKRLMR